MGLTMKIYKKDLLEINSYLENPKIPTTSNFYSQFLAKFPLFSDPSQKLEITNLRKLSVEPTNMDLFNTITEEEARTHARFFKAVLHLVCQNKSLKELEILAETFSCAQIVSPSLKTQISKELRLIINAEKYGSKAANLIDTAELLIEAELPIPVEIPDFVPISQQEMMAHIDRCLKENDYPSIQEMWQQFCFVQKESNTQLTLQARAQLGLIRERIIAMSRSDHFCSTELKGFLERNSHQRLMVRSTSNEDSEDLDNAGGNETQSNVAPDLEIISQKIGDVIASYFSEKSFEQRLLCGDDVLQIPNLAVLIQQMVGAEDEPERFCSGIGYREEPLAQTRGTSAVHSAPGQGEMLVNSEGAADDYYIGEMENIEPIVRDKKFRKAPSPEGGLVLKKNPESIRRKPALEDDYLITLHRLMGLLQIHQHCAVDIEFVVDKLEKKILLVQRRPLIFETGSARAQYMEIADSSPQEVIHGNLIISADMQVRELSNPDEILFGQDISTFHRFRRMESQDQKKVKCVILKENALRMSHEANQFRRLNIPVISVTDKNAYEKLKARIENCEKVMVETLTGKIYLSSAALIKEGMIESPIPLERSLRDAIPSPFAIAPLNSPQQMKELLQILKTSDSEEQIKNAYDRMTTILANYFHRVLKQRLSKENTALSLRVAQNIFSELPALRKGLEFPSGTAERVFPVKFLEALLYQPLRPELVDAESVKTIMEETNAEKEIKKKYGTAHINEEMLPYYFQYIKLLNGCARQGLDEHWSTFLAYVLSDPSSNQKLARILLDFQAQNLGSFWLNVCFYSAWKKAAKDPVKCLDQLWERYEKVGDDLKFLNYISKEVAEAQTTMPLFGQPEQFHEAYMSTWTKLFNHASSLVDFIKRRKLFSDDNSEYSLISHTAFDLLERICEVMDQSIKTLTGAPESEYPDVDQKVERFGILTGDFIVLLLKIAKPIPLNIAAMIRGVRKDSCNPNYLTDRVRWLLQIHCNLIKNPSSKLMEISPDFDVQRLRFPKPESLKNKPRVDFTRYPPKTLEEVFTTTHGQIKDLIRLWRDKIASLHSGLKAKHLNKGLKGLLTLQKNWGDIPCAGRESAHLNEHVSICGRHLIQSCVLPGEAHEGKFELTTDILSGDTTLYLKMVGDDGHGRAGTFRWSNVIFYALLAGKLLNLEYTEAPKKNEFDGGFSEVTMTWKFNIEKLSTEGKIDEFSLFFKEVFALMMAATMADRAIKDRRFDKFSFKDNNSLLQVIHNLRVAGGENIVQLIDELSEEFFLSYPYYNDQFCQYYKERFPEKTINIAHSSLLQCSSGEAKLFASHLVNFLTHDQKDIRVKAFGHTLQLILNPRFILAHPSVAEELGSALAASPELAFESTMILDAIDLELQRGKRPKSVGTLLLSLKKKGIEDTRLESCIHRFLEEKNLERLAPYEMFFLSQFYPEKEEGAKDRIFTFLGSLTQEKLPQDRQMRRQVMQDLLNLAMQNYQSLDASASLSFFNALVLSDKEMGNTHFCDAYLDVLMKFFIKKRNVEGMVELSKCMHFNWEKGLALMQEVHTYDPERALSLFKNWTKKHLQLIKFRIFRILLDLLESNSPFKFLFFKTIVKRDNALSILKNHLPSFFAILQKNKNEDDFIKLAVLCYRFKLGGGMPQLLGPFCREQLPANLSRWNQGLRLLIENDPKNSILRSLLTPSLEKNEDKNCLKAKFLIVINHLEQVPNSLGIAKQLAESMIFQGDFSLINEICQDKTGEWKKNFESFCQTAQSYYETYDGLKSENELIVFCEKLLQVKPFPSMPFFTAYLKLAESSTDFLKMKRLLDSIKAKKGIKIGFIKRFALIVKERKEIGALKLGKAVLKYLYEYNVDKEWLENFITSDNKRWSDALKKKFEVLGHVWPH